MRERKVDVARLNVPNWFGPAPAALERDAVVVALRAPLSPRDMDKTQPGRNGWRYSSQASSILVEAVSHQVAATHFVAWTDLLQRLIEPNVFLDPCFVLPAVQHFAMARRPAFVLVWDESEGERHKLIGLCPVMLPRPHFGGTTATAWLHEHASVGMPLIDRAQAIETLDLIVDWLGREHPHLTGLMIPKLRREGPMLALLRARAIMSGRDIRLFGEHERAMLPGGGPGRQAEENVFSPKKLKELRRQRRRLADTGKLVYSSARTPAEVREATERFLALEAAGWKGRRGTALLSDPGLTTFTRAMTRLLARDGICRIDTLEVDGKAVGMGIVLHSGGYGYLWKIAYDEAFRAASPGVQFVLDLTKAQLEKEGVAFTDSCAIPDHPMIDHVWRERLAIADALVSIRPAASRRFALSAAGETARRGLRSMLKAAYHRASGRKNV